VPGRRLLAIGLAAVGGAGAFALVLAVQTPVPARAAIAHRCGSGDRDFVRGARPEVDGLGRWTEDYRRGGVTAGEVLRWSNGAALRVGRLAPRDPALRTARALLVSTFAELGRAVRAREHGRDPGAFVARAYGLANDAHDELEQSAPELRAMGCDVTPLL
jgi:hypothetical protein